MNFPDIVKMITQFLAETPSNRVDELGIKRIFDDPLVGLASADDPLFGKLKEPDIVDIWICSQYLDSKIKPFFYPRYGCGKCQTAVPCENSVP